MVACMSLLGRRVSLKMASSVRRWMSVKTSRGFLWTGFCRCPLTAAWTGAGASVRWPAPRPWRCWCWSDAGNSCSRSLHAEYTQHRAHHGHGIDKYLGTLLANQTASAYRGKWGQMTPGKTDEKLKSSARTPLGELTTLPQTP